MPSQVSVFMENKPGRLERVTAVLSEGQINIRAMTLTTSSAGWGVLNLLVDQPQQAVRVLCDTGHPAVLRQIMAVEMPDRPGGLHQVVSLLARAGLNVQNAYGTVLRGGNRAVLVVDVENVAAASDVFAKAGVKILSDTDVYTI